MQTHEDSDLRTLTTALVEITYNGLRERTACQDSFTQSTIDLERLTDLVLSQLDYLESLDSKQWRDFFTDALMRSDVPLDLGPYARQVLMRNQAAAYKDVM